MKDQIRHSRRNSKSYRTGMEDPAKSFSSAERKSVNTTFPSTTNQDFHNQEVYSQMHQKNTNYNISMLKKNNHGKKVNEYTAYVNAMFNSGVYNLPQCG